MRLSAFGVVVRYGPFSLEKVDLVPCGFSDLAASGCCQGEELQGVDSSLVGAGGFNGSESVADLVVGKGFVVFRTVLIFGR